MTTIFVSPHVATTVDYTVVMQKKKITIYQNKYQSYLADYRRVLQGLPPALNQKATHKTEALRKISSFTQSHVCPTWCSSMKAYYRHWIKTFFSELHDKLAIQNSFWELRDINSQFCFFLRTAWILSILSDISLWHRQHWGLSLKPALNSKILHFLIEYVKFACAKVTDTMLDCCHAVARWLLGWSEWLLAGPNQKCPSPSL